ncbi:MAG: AAA family ATPase [Rhizobiaceae bacterium]|jgi:predicted ATPase|nr:AAA family ATPase [Rhizobiaceae bacterium]
MIHAGENLFVVTGGPGAGKTTLLQAAAIAGYRTVPESGRAIITLQEAIGGRALHYADSAAYAELMLDRDMQNHQAHAASTELTLYDRGVADLVGYCRLVGIEDAEHIYRAAELFRYNRKVFLAPPWRDIYVQDNQRRQEWSEAVHTYECIANAYSELDYDLIELPLAPVAERLAFLEDEIAIAV